MSKCISVCIPKDIFERITYEQQQHQQLQQHQWAINICHRAPSRMQPISLCFQKRPGGEATTTIKHIVVVVVASSKSRMHTHTEKRLWIGESAAEKKPPHDGRIENIIRQQNA